MRRLLAHTPLCERHPQGESPSVSVRGGSWYKGSEPLAFPGRNDATARAALAYSSGGGFWHGVLETGEAGLYAVGIHGFNASVAGCSVGDGQVQPTASIAVVSGFCA